MNYYIGDIHAFYLCGRSCENIFDMQRILIKKWNAKVTNADTVYILGDIAGRGDGDSARRLVERLKGKKVLITGDHDDVRDIRYRQLFEEICGYKEIVDSVDGYMYRLVLCHYPILFWHGQDNGYIQLYGHVHDSWQEGYYREALARINLMQKVDKNAHEVVAINVGAMMPNIGLEPRSLKELLAAKEERVL